ncbi:4-(cytidine 5'-diphospho)-2-C-methyl-D-erythritol kinase [Hoeflea sp.]|uniref:4-(cytidine 5'-diphospho)-2-C-methyl-D-erythritol kinase n=1 Tax=Hoeflea sp. TaxID=1940281 RepID=UPI003749C356
MSNPQSLNAPAKVNLALHVTGRRDDGYHPLETFAVFTELGDRVSAQPDDQDSFSIGGPEAGPLLGEVAGSNLVTRARDVLRQAARADGLPAPPVRLHLDKCLPVASGIGGGSADAAAALKLLARLWGYQPAPERLADIGLELGADVPMCLASRPLVASGIGEALAPVELGFVLDLVIVNPRIGVSTPVVFSALESRTNPPLPAPEGVSDKTRFINWLKQTRNDLEPPACLKVPGIADCLQSLRTSGALFARMSGSGASCFGLYESASAAKTAAIAIGKDQPGWFVQATRTLPPVEQPVQE